MYISDCHRVGQVLIQNRPGPHTKLQASSCVAGSIEIVENFRLWCFGVLIYQQSFGMKIACGKLKIALQRPLPNSLYPQNFFQFVTVADAKKGDPKFAGHNGRRG